MREKEIARIELALISSGNEELYTVRFKDTMANNLKKDKMNLSILAMVLLKSLEKNSESADYLRELIKHLSFILSAVATSDVDINNQMNECVKCANKDITENMLKANGIEGIEV